jgi:hypothetical protein
MMERLVAATEKADANQAKTNAYLKEMTAKLKAIQEKM